MTAGLRALGHDDVDALRHLALRVLLGAHEGADQDPVVVRGPDHLRRRRPEGVDEHLGSVGEGDLHLARALLVHP